MSLPPEGPRGGPLPDLPTDATKLALIQHMSAIVQHFQQGRQTQQQSQQQQVKFELLAVSLRESDSFIYVIVLKFCLRTVLQCLKERLLA